MTVVIFLIVLAVLIFVHELGHFLAARACGIRVDKFAIGFGPRIVSWKGKETEYSINIIPFGGYVKIFGENPDQESISGPDSGRSFVNKPRWQQIIVLAAGVLFNFVFAWLLYIIVFTTGVTATTSGFEQYQDRFQNERVMITLVSPGSPAESAGLKAGDVLESISLEETGGTMLAIDGRDELVIEEIQKIINDSEGRSLLVGFTRGDTALTTTLAAATGLVEDRYAIGIAMDRAVDLKLPFITSIKEGTRYFFVLTRETVFGLYNFFADIFKGSADFSSVAGPVGIAGIIGGAADLGITYLIMITALISINLGIINLIPFPALDGGRILFVLIESVIRRRIPAVVANTVNAVGFVLLMILMIVVTYKDIARLLK